MKTYESNEKKLFIFGEYRLSGFPGGLLCCTTISVSSSFLLQYSIIMQREKTTAGVLFTKKG